MKQLLRENKRENRIMRKVKIIKENISLIGLVIFLVLITFLSLKLDPFKVKEITCKTQYGDCSLEDSRLFDKYKGENLLFISTGEIQKKGEENVSNRKVLAQRVFPGALNIILEKRKPVIALASLDPRSPTLLIDQEGVVVDIGRETSLPTIMVNREIKNIYLGKKLDQPIVHAVQTMYLMTKAQQAAEGRLDKDSLKISLSSGPEVNFALDRDPQVLVGALQLIETRSRIEGKLPKVIDLRYIKPVLTY